MGPINVVIRDPEFIQNSRSIPSGPIGPQSRPVGGLGRDAALARDLSRRVVALVACLREKWADGGPLRAPMTAS